MAKKKETTKAGNKTQEAETKIKPAYLAAAALAFIAIVVASYFIVSGLYSNSNPTGSFSTFRSNFYYAPRVAIYATAYNGTVMSGTVGCATAIIENIVASTQAHRNSSTIDFFIINQTKCTYVSGLGKSNGTETTLARVPQHGRCRADNIHKLQPDQRDNNQAGLSLHLGRQALPQRVRRCDGARVIFTTPVCAF